MELKVLIFGAEELGDMPICGHGIFQMSNEKRAPAWRIIPVTKWLITMVLKSPRPGVVPLTNGNSWLINGGLLTTY